MKKLRTLKEIEGHTRVPHITHINACLTEELKEEAVRWVKCLRDYSWQGSKSSKKAPTPLRRFQIFLKRCPVKSEQLERWIMYFFNLKEEDLKWQMKNSASTKVRRRSNVLK